MAKRVKNYEKFSKLFYVLCGIFAFSLILYLIGVISPGFANAYNSSVGAAVRSFLAHLTSWIPFSLAEILVFSVPLLLVFVGIYAYRYRCESWKSTLIFLATMLSVFSIFFSLFAFGFGIGYHTDPIDDRLGIKAEEVSVDALHETALWLADEVNKAANGVRFGEDGFSIMPYELQELNDRLIDAYEPVCDAYPFVQRLDSHIKPVIASKLLSYTHITGIYTYFTGEANVNVAFPDYTVPFTAAHELAHQRGVARENEASFVAFLVTVASDDDYIRYSGYLNLFEYVASALYRADHARYAEVIDVLDDRVLGELRAYSAFFDTYRDSVAADLSDAVNDTYLKLHGNKAGTASYGLVVDLAVAYRKQMY
ncbi:MAG: DUF3810 domain-containing protein [Clostridia bacterium]|nr:DUF3810 domain-containing protein [Clostridia bacterium]